MPTVNAFLNPISRDGLQADIEAGTSLHEQMQVPGDCLVYRNGEPYQGEIIKENDLLTIFKAPQGGDQNKDIARNAFQIAVVAAAAYFTAGMGPLAAGLIRGGVYFGSALLAEKLIPWEEL